jgi:sugar lactone lactonase YvrE
VTGDVDLDVAVGPGAEIPEGPMWDGSTGALYWLDVLVGDLHRFDPRTGKDESRPLGRVVSSLARRTNGELLLSLQDGFASFDEGSGRIELLAAVEADRPRNRLNDGRCDPRGRFWAGTMEFEGEPGAGSLYRLEPDLTVTRVFGGVSVSNGIGWSPDHRFLYYVDTPAEGIDVLDYDVESGAVSNRRRLVDVASETGHVDGLTVDADGYVWVALFHGWAVHRYGPDGTLDRVLRMPTSQVTSCTFGGSDLGDLYITTAAYRMVADQRRREPLAGAVFRCRPGVIGQPTVPFGG